MNDELGRALAASLPALTGMKQPPARLAEIATDLPPHLARLREAADRLAAFEDDPHLFAAAQADLRG